MHLHGNHLVRSRGGPGARRCGWRGALEADHWPDWSGCAALGSRGGEENREGHRPRKEGSSDTKKHIAA